MVGPLRAFSLKINAYEAWRVTNDLLVAVRQIYPGLVIVLPQLQVQATRKLPYLVAGLRERVKKSPVASSRKVIRTILISRNIGCWQSAFALLPGKWVYWASKSIISRLSLSVSTTLPAKTENPFARDR